MRSALGAVVRRLGLVLALSGCAASPTPVRLASAFGPDGHGGVAIALRSFVIKAGTPVEMVPMGTAAALQLLARGDTDAAIVDSLSDAQAFVAQHPERIRVPLWRLRVSLIGPPDDPAHVRGLSLSAALAAIAASRQPFVSTGDRSGLHRREQELWVQAGSPPKGAWYLSAGIGLQGALHLAGQRHAYLLCDQVSYAAAPQDGRLTPLVAGSDEQALAVELLYGMDSRPGSGRMLVLADLVATLTMTGNSLPAGYLPPLK
ncbi:MAG: hypothetical protein H7338_00820 [Candidatus Sericytochromatia bacterium]|nr:hypothetical protein [Candidatus Sericytochromatia bacterium]